MELEVKMFLGQTTRDKITAHEELKPSRNQIKTEV